ncbi:hypothetical protein DL769_011620 [Monosporascus sp. CRB-8-3]|nr:hypothetical protein DL769_011620 [Monosporascus sp. CRB-8-3]
METPHNGRQLSDLQAELSQHKRDMVPDFKATLISRKDLGELAKYTYNVPYFSELEDALSETAKSYNVRFDLQCAPPIDDLGGYITSYDPAKNYPRKLEMIRSVEDAVECVQEAGHDTNLLRTRVGALARHTYNVRLDPLSMPHPSAT